METRHLPSHVPLSIPKGSWDSHMHVFDPKYPLVKDAQYGPSIHLLEQALEKESDLGIDNIVLVQPSGYGNDNSCLLDALCRLGPHRARGVVAFDYATIDHKTLLAWHRIGVRGVRVNFQSVGKQIEAQELEDLLQRYADIIRPLGWVLQLHITLSAITLLEKIVPRLNVKVCLDHFCSPSIPNGYHGDQYPPELAHNFLSLLRLVEETNTYVKISAYYRLCEDVRQLEVVAKALLRVADGRKVVFGTDWPHVRYTDIDIKPFVQIVLDWCSEDKRLVNRVFRDNAVKLWDVEKMDSSL